MKFNRRPIEQTEGVLHINQPIQQEQQTSRYQSQAPQTNPQANAQQMNSTPAPQRPRFGSRRYSTEAPKPQQTNQGQTQREPQVPAGNPAHPQQRQAQPVQQEQRTINKILPKFVNRTKNGDRGSAVEFVKSAFDLCKTDVHGNRESFDGKMLMNFWTFDKASNHQLDFIPAYIDISEWLNVCHMILSGRLHDLTAEARANSQNGYAPFVYQSNGGSMKAIFKKNGQTFGGDGPKATLFKITPAKRDNSWVLSAEVYEGIQSQTGLIQVKSGSKPHIKIQVLMSYDDLVRVARMSEMVIQAHIMKLI